MRENLDPWRAKCIQNFREWGFNGQMAQCEKWEKQLRAEEEGKDVQAKAAEKQKDFQANIAEKAKQAALEEEKRGDEKRKKDRAEAAKRMTTTAIARKAALATDAEASNNGEGPSRAQEQRTHTGNAESRKGFMSSNSRSSLNPSTAQPKPLSFSQRASRTSASIS